MNEIDPLAKPVENLSPVQESEWSQLPEPVAVKQERFTALQKGMIASGAFAVSAVVLVSVVAGVSQMREAAYYNKLKRESRVVVL